MVLFLKLRGQTALGDYKTLHSVCVLNLLPRHALGSLRMSSVWRMPKRKPRERKWGGVGGSLWGKSPILSPAFVTAASYQSERSWVGSSKTQCSVLRVTGEQVKPESFNFVLKYNRISFSFFFFFLLVTQATCWKWAKNAVFCQNLLWQYNKPKYDNEVKKKKRTIMSWHATRTLLRSHPEFWFMGCVSSFFINTFHHKKHPRFSIFN